MPSSPPPNKKYKKGQPTDPHKPRPRRSITSFSMHEICHLRDLVGAQETDPTVVALVYVHGSWNNAFLPHNSKHKTLPKHHQVDRFSLLEGLLSNCTTKNDTQHVIGALQVDQSEDTYACCVGDDHFTGAHCATDVPIPPSQLPVLAVGIQTPHQTHARVRYLKGIAPSRLLWYSVLQRNPNIHGSGKAFEEQQTKWSEIVQSTIGDVLEGLEASRKEQPPKEEKENSKKRKQEEIL